MTKYEGQQRKNNMEMMTNKMAVSLLGRYPPKMHESLNLRRYLPPQGYLSPNVVEALTVMHIEMAEDPKFDFQKIGGATANVFGMACWQCIHGWPMFAVTQELLDAMLLTDPPGEMTWGELEWPLTAITFLLPDSKELRAYLHCPEAPPALMMGRLRVPPPNTPPHLNRCFDMVRMPNGSIERDMAVLVYFDTKVGTPMFHDITARPEWSLSETLDSRSFRKDLDTDIEMEEIDFERMERATLLGINLLAFMSSTYQPDIVAPMTQHRAAKVKKGKTRDALYGVRWLGQGFRLARPPVAGGGHHKSPIWHWRRGHFRNQPFGIGRKQRKVLWIQPMVVNSEGKEIGQ